ncbi:MAG TPA: hypothetical protein VFE30_12410 [Anaeromyxobacteraceae bacterium]|jgi:hypothetical protein|nr:hypothetical protein [Anaeromyxobacteraceae bacterium]
MNTLPIEVSMRRSLHALLPVLLAASAACGGPAEAGAVADAGSGSNAPAQQSADGGQASGATGASTPGGTVTSQASAPASAWQPCAATLPANQPVRAVSGASGADLWAVGPAGMVLHRTASGWSAFCRAGGPSLAAVWSAAANDAWMVGDGLVLHFDGAALSEVAPPQAATPLRAVWGSSASDVWVLAAAEVLHFDGKAWSRTAAAAMQTLGFDFGAFRDVWGAGPAEVTIAAERGTLRFDGKGWYASLAAPADQLLQSTWSSGAGDAWVAGKNLDGGSALWRYAGTSWAPQALVQRSVIDAVRGSSGNDVWFLAGAELLHWDGAALSSATAPPAAPAGAPHVLGPRDLYLPDAQGIAHWDGAAWTRALGR